MLRRSDVWCQLGQGSEKDKSSQWPWGQLLGTRGHASWPQVTQYNPANCHICSLHFQSKCTQTSRTPLGPLGPCSKGTSLPAEMCPVEFCLWVINNFVRSIFCNTLNAQVPFANTLCPMFRVWFLSDATMVPRNLCRWLPACQSWAMPSLKGVVPGEKELLSCPRMRNLGP